jgi:hypothetical protein
MCGLISSALSHLHPVYIETTQDETRETMKVIIKICTQKMNKIKIYI